MHPGKTVAFHPTAGPLKHTEIECHPTAPNASKKTVASHPAAGTLTAPKKKKKDKKMKLVSKRMHKPVKVVKPLKASKNEPGMNLLSRLSSLNLGMNDDASCTVPTKGEKARAGGKVITKWKEVVK